MYVMYMRKRFHLPNYKLWFTKSRFVHLSFFCKTSSWPHWNFGGWGCVLFIKEEEFASFYLSALHM